MHILQVSFTYTKVFIQKEDTRGLAVSRINLVQVKQKYHGSVLYGQIIIFSLILFIFCPEISFSKDRPNDLIQQISETTNLEKRTRLLMRLSRHYQYVNIDSALIYSYQAQDIINSTGLKNDTIKAESELLLGRIYCWTQDTINGFEHLDNSIRMAENLGLASISASGYTSKGLTFGKLHVYDQSMICLEKSRNIYLGINDTIGVLRCNNNIGLIYLDLKAYDKADRYFKENYQMAVKLNNFHGQAITLSNMGNVSSGTEEYDQAIEYYLKSNAIADSLGLKFGVMHSFAKLGKIYAKKNMWEIAFDYSQRAHSLAVELGQKTEIVKTAITLAKSLNKQKKYQQASQIGANVLSDIEDISSKETKADIYQTLANSYQGLKKFETSISYYEKYEAIRDELADLERAKMFAEIDIQYQVDKKDKENQALKLAYQKGQIIKEQRTLLAMGIGLGTVLLSLLTLNLYLNNRRRKENVIQMEQKVQERTEHLNAANIRLQKANEELESFAYITSHDLKEPLRNISSFAGLLEHKLGVENIDQLKEYLKFIISNTKQMHTLIEDVLSYSKNGKSSEDNKLKPFSAIIDQVKTELQTTIKEKNAQIIINSNSLEKGLGLIKLPTQLTPVFKNLIENGIKYNKRTVPQILISFKQNTTHAIFLIADNGIGIPAEFHSRIFEMFKRLHNRSEYTGSGIGLAICKKTIENLKGKISVESKENIGSTFKIELPISILQENKVSAMLN